jgi:deazaflavin-dependent oxidoreductase (nitroreductase family)
MPQQRPSQLDSPLLPKIFKYAGKAHMWVYRRTAARSAGSGASARASASRCRRRDRRLPGRTGRRPAVVPQSLANPDSYIEIGAERRAVHAVTPGPDERARLWPKLVELYADFDNYQSWTDREIPVVVLRPR